MRGRIFKYIFFFSIFILLAFPVYANESGDWCTERKLRNCLDQQPANSKKALFVQEINKFLSIQSSLNCNITQENLSNYAFWGKQQTVGPCNLSQNIAGWMSENCSCESSHAAYPAIDPSSSDPDYVSFNNALGREIFSLLQKGAISINGTPVPTPNSSASTPTPISTPTPTRNPEDPNLELSDVQIQMAKCGLRAANYQCCYPNAEISGSLPSGSFFNAIDKLWETIRETIESNASRLNFFQSDISNSVTDGSNYPPDLCPRTEEGERKERFYKVVDDTKWLDQLDKYSGSENITNYENFLYGTANDAGDRDFKTDGLVGAIYSSTALPLMTSDEGVTYQGATYNCVCVNPATELNKTPDYFQNLPTNTVNTNDSPSSLTDLNPSKLCRNIKDPRENAECMACVHGGKAQKNGINWDWIKPTQTPNTDLGGAWTAVGCIKADFSSTLQDTLFPLFISLGGLISLGCIIYASFLLQTSMGEPEKITKAQELMTSCITGLIVIIFSVFILRVIGVDILRLPGFTQ